MSLKLKHIAIVVKDYDEAILYYTQKLNFVIIEDTKISEEKRWIIIAPSNSSECSFLLAKAVNEDQENSIGNQTGGRVFLFLNTNNFTKEYQNLISNNVKIIREPKNEVYGKVAVFEDLYGNLWDLIEPKTTKLFYSTAILNIIDNNNVSFAISEIMKLKVATNNEQGNIVFDIHQSKEDNLKIIIWECFKNEAAFKEHLSSKHLQDFLNLNVVEIENGYVTQLIE
ncbi:VOC family protein [Flavobacterium soyangense]|uniref:VOC family protein n=1 Tax=Flavobacterium soyangense TaxID=2023265 RepID=A0A930UEB6_9FLAO|nr:VOC family protein [Flavobacterium soyangense]MBF2708850.1 VOC family protein [Flavobacterium soyangense]